MGNLSNNLSRSEFACECECGFDTVDIELVAVLQDVVDHFEIAMAAPMVIKITGGNRCKEHNEMVQKEANPSYVPYSSNSQHMYARAADFKVFNKNSGLQIPQQVVADYLETKYLEKYGVGRYSNRTHADTKTGAARRWG